MSQYHVRHDSMTQATTTFAVVETGSDGSTAGPIRIPKEAKRIKSITVGFAIDGAQVTDTGVIPVVRLTGTNALPGGPHDLVVFSCHLDDGSGTLTYTDSQIVPTFHLDTDIAVVGGSDLTIQAAYYGTDSGSPQIAVELELE